MLDFIFGPIPVIISALIVIGLVALVYAKSVYKHAAPNEALIITGKRSKRTVVDGHSQETSGAKIVVGSGVWVTPFFSRSHRLSLSSRALEIQVDAQDVNGVIIAVDAVAIVKVGGKHESILAAAERFLGEDKHIDTFAQEVLSGSLRSSIGATTVHQIIKERAELGEAVLSTARESLLNQGLDVDSFEIKSLGGNTQYLADLGRAEQAQARKIAEIAESDAQRQARQAQIAAEEAVAIAENTLARKKAELQLETDKATAEAAAAKPLAEAKAQQAVVDAQEETARRQAQLRKAQLESEVNAVADAQAYKTRTEADAAAFKMGVEATASADAVLRAANSDRDARIAVAAAVAAEGAATRDARIAVAAAVAAEGQADADAILARGTAEAEATRLAAEAVAEQSDSLIRLKMIDALPLIARELAAPMSSIDQLTVISTDGASQLTKNVASGFGEVDGVLKAQLGFGVSDILGSVLGGNAAGATLAKAAAAGPRGVTE
jgi:flotillin